MKSKLIHLGSGALGLGLVLPIFSGNTLTKIYLANRRGKEDDPSTLKNQLLLEKYSYFIKSGDLESNVTIDDFIYFDEFKKFEDLLKIDELIFITTTLKDGIIPSIPFIGELIHLRNCSNIKSPLVVISCENAVNSIQVYEQVLIFLQKKYDANYQLGEEIIFVNSVVDRMCNLPFVDKNNDVCLFTESHCQWLIDYSAIKQLANNNHKTELKRFFNSLQNTTMVSDIDFYIKRKKWIVNALHLLLGLATHSLHKYSIKNFVNTADGLEIMQGLANELNLIYLHNEPDAKVDETIKYIEETKDRFSAFPTNVFKVIGRFVDTDTLPKFFTDFYRKVGEPTTKFMLENKRPLLWIPLILLWSTDKIAKEQFVIDEGK